MKDSNQPFSSEILLKKVQEEEFDPKDVWEMLGNTLKQSGEDLAYVLFKIDNIYKERYEPQKQIEILELALPVFEEIYGQNHSNVGMLLVNLYVPYATLGKGKEKKEALLGRAFSILDSSSDATDGMYATLLTNLGNLEGKSGDLHQSKEYLEKALSLVERANDEEKKAKVLTSLADTCLLLKSPQEAKSHLKEALEIKRRVDEEGQGVSTAITLRSLGMVCMDSRETKEELQEAENSCLEALEIFKTKRFYPIEIAKTSIILGQIYGMLEIQDKAIPHLKEAEKIISLLPNNHQEKAPLMNMIKEDLGLFDKKPSCVIT